MERLENQIIYSFGRNKTKGSKQDSQNSKIWCDTIPLIKYMSNISSPSTRIQSMKFRMMTQKSTCLLWINFSPFRLALERIKIKSNIMLLNAYFYICVFVFYCIRTKQSRGSLWHIGDR